MNLRKLRLNLKTVFWGHIFNPLWKPREWRRTRRGRVIADAVMEYLEPYAAFAAALKPDCTDGGDVSFADGRACGGDVKPIFSIWLQGEDSAPAVVKACWRSIRANCPGQLIVLDSTTLSEYISLPEYIMGKWRSGLIRPAHFADICRVELLRVYGGLWLDATDYVPGPLPEWLWKEPFFVYLSGKRQRGSYSFIQNCFIRAAKGDFLVSAWRDLIFEYWKREDSVADYFVHQLLFRLLVENNDTARSAFERMPQVVQDATHVLWFDNASAPYERERFDSVCAAAMFQKTEYKSATAECPPSGSMAERLVNSFQDNFSE